MPFAKHHSKEMNELKLDLGNAAARGDIATMEKLMTSGALADRSSLILASANGQFEAVKLLAGKARCNPTDLGIVLCDALRNRHWAIAKWLLEKGADPNVKYGMYLMPPLVLAADGGSTELVEQLLGCGANPNSYEEAIGAALTGRHVQRTALMTAAKQGNEYITHLLLSSGADPAIKDTKGRTAYDLVASRRDRSAIALLLVIALRKKGRSSSSRPTPSATVHRKDNKEPVVSNFREAIDSLSERAGHPMEPSGSVRGALSFGITLDEAVYLLRDMGKKPSRNITALLMLVREFAPMFEKVGGSLFLLSDRSRGFLICAVPWADKLKTIRALKTASANYGISNSRLVSFLRELDQRHPFTLERCDSQAVGGRFTGKISNPKALAGELVDICPFINEDFQGKTSAFSKALQKDGAFTLWWD